MICKPHRRAICAAICALISGLACAQIKRESVSFETAPGPHLRNPVMVDGALNLPTAPAKLPAVLVLHSRAGIDGTGAFYADALNQSGIATLEIEMFRSATQMPRDSRENLPHTFGALHFLAMHPAIDAQRIGVVGFSRGGGLALMAASTLYQDIYNKGNFAFSAFASLYPVCSAHLDVLQGKWMNFERGVYDKLSGKPILLLAGELDDYEASNSCSKFTAALPAEMRSKVVLTIYPGATHGWEIPGDRTYQHDVAKQRGGQVRYRYDPKTAELSRQAVTQFFRINLNAQK
jgi:dienelactone hydrolase